MPATNVTAGGGGVIVVTFYLCIYPSLDLPYNTFKMNWPIFLKLNKEHFTFHLQCKHSGTFANRQTIRENATPSSGTSPLASYKEAPSPAPRAVTTGTTTESYIGLTTNFQERYRNHLTSLEETRRNCPNMCGLSKMPTDPFTCDGKYSGIVNPMTRLAKNVICTSKKFFFIICKKNTYVFWTKEANKQVRTPTEIDSLSDILK